MGDIKPSHKGLLHEFLGVPKSQKIPVAKIEKAKAQAKRTGNKKLLKQTTYALNVRK